MNGEIISLSERFTNKQKQLKYPIEDPKRIEEIEDMAGKKNRAEALENYKNEIRAKRQKYHEEQSKIDNEFKLALFKDYSVEKHPAREKAFSMAWSRGHAEGYGSIEYEFSELVELIKYITAIKLR
jgi:hypothetical protein